MKKIFIFIIAIALLFSGCTNISTNLNSGQDSFEETFENIIEKNNVSCNDYIEYEGNLAVALSDKIIAKFNSIYKEIDFKKPNDLSADKDYLYFLNENKNEIYSIDYKSFQVRSVYSTDDIITFYYAVGNGNLFIETSTKNNQSSFLETKSEFILNPKTNKCYNTDDSTAYLGASCISIDLQNETEESITRLFYDKSYLDFDYISNPCRIGNYIYYTKNPKVINKDKYIFTIYAYSITDEKESVFAEFEANNQNGIWDFVIKDIFAYNDNIYLETGINQRASSEYECLEFYQINSKGKIVKTYKISDTIDSETIKFFNNSIYYNDIDGGLNKIDLVYSKTKNESNPTNTIESQIDMVEETNGLNEYQGFLNVDSNEFYKKINDNPIDNYYFDKLKEQSNLNNQIEIIHQWTNSYEKEYEYIYQYLISELKKDNSENALSLVNNLEEFDKASNYPSLIANLTFSAEHYALGNGSDHKYDAVNNELIYERTKVLMLVEIFNLSFDKDYTWQFNA